MKDNVKSKIENLRAIEAEVNRFKSRLHAAVLRLKDDPNITYSGCKETGALKRSALDLKVALTEITQAKY